MLGRGAWDLFVVGFRSFLDTVRVGDLEVKKQLLIQVDHMESDTHMKSDGILGLAHHYASDRSLRGETFVSTLFRHHPRIGTHRWDA
eukprot:Skav229078  [mRNA]  locus=scaffold157:112621:115354:- [translate_table: standard]